MKPITAIERFLADAPTQPQPQPAVTASLPDGAIGRFFVLNPIDVQHPTAQVCFMLTMACLWTIP